MPMPCTCAFLISGLIFLAAVGPVARAQDAAQARQILAEASAQLAVPNRLSMGVDVVRRTTLRSGAILREHHAVVFRRDQSRLEARDKCFFVSDLGEQPGWDTRRLWDGSTYWEYSSKAGLAPGALTLAASPEMVEPLIYAPECWGLGTALPGMAGPMFASLESAPSLGVKANLERIGEAYCHHLIAESSGWSCDLWLDPAGAYLPRRIVFTGNASQPHGNQAAAPDVDGPSDALSLHYLLDRVVTDVAGDRRVITEAVATTTYLLPGNRRQTVVATYRRRSIDVNPDFTGAGAFQINVPEGTVVNRAYVWKDGRLVSLLGSGTLERMLEPVEEMLSKGEATIQLTTGAALKPAQPPLPRPPGGHGWLEAIALMAACVVVLLSLYVFFQTRGRAGKPRNWDT